MIRISVVPFEAEHLSDIVNMISVMVESGDTNIIMIHASSYTEMSAVL